MLCAAKHIASMLALSTDTGNANKIEELAEEAIFVLGNVGSYLTHRDKVFTVNTASEIVW